MERFWLAYLREWRELQRRDNTGNIKTLGSTYGVDVEVACVENDWPIHVVVVHVLEGDVLDVSVANVWSGPSLKSCTVLEQQH